MNWIKGLRFLNKFPKPTGEISKCGVSQYSCVNKNRKGICDTENFPAFSLQQPGGCVPATSFQQTNLGSRHRDPQQTLMLTRNMLGNFELSSCIEGGIFRSKGHEVVVRRWYGQRLQNDPELNREFLARLWVHDKKMKRSRARRRQKVGRWFSGTSPVLEQPPLSQSATGVLAPASLEEARVAPLLARSNLLITRDIEWANLVFGFEQENRYAVVDVCYPESPVGFIREQSNLIARQLLRSRRPFVACITDAMGSELFRVRRPFWWITSSIYAEIDGKEVGVVHRRWHLWKRIYDLYLRNKQFAVVENPGLWNWTFTLKDIDGQVLAQIDRDWRGFGFEIFTDAGQYVIRFGSTDNSAKIGPAGVVEELEVIRPLTLAERAVAVALAVSLDNDYFSRHGGWGLPFVEVGEFSD